MTDCITIEHSEVSKIMHVYEGLNKDVFQNEARQQDQSARSGFSEASHKIRHKKTHVLSEGSK